MSSPGFYRATAWGQEEIPFCLSVPGLKQAGTSRPLAVLGGLFSEDCHSSLTFLTVMARCLVLGGWKLFLLACCGYGFSTVNLALRDLRILLLYI